MDFSKLTPKQFKELTADLLPRLKEVDRWFTRISRLNVQPTKVYLEGTSLKMSYNTKSMELEVWSASQRGAGRDYSVNELLNIREVCREWQRDHKHFREWE